MTTERARSVAEQRVVQRVRAFIESLDAPLALRDFPETEVAAVKELIAKGIVGVTNDWKVWPIGKALPQ